MRCKRCGSTLSYEDVMCKGCGKSLVDLKAKDEIEFDDNATINIEPIKHTEVPKVEIEEPKVEDVFGDAIYNQEKVETNELEEEKLDDIKLPTPEINSDIKPLNVVPEVSEEVINAEPISQDITNQQENISPENIVIPSNEQEEISVEPLPVKQVELEDNVIPNVEVAPVLNVSELKEENKMVDDFVPKKKSKKGIIFVIITLIVLALAGVVVYVFIKTNPKSIFETGLTKLFSYGNLETVTSPLSKGEMYLKLNIENTNQNPMYEILNNLTIDVKSHIDKTNRNLMVSFDSKYSNSDLLKATVYGNNSMLYGLLDNVYEKYIGYQLDQETYNKIFEENDYLDEIKVVLNELKNELSNSLDNKYFTRAIKGTDTISTFSLNKNDYITFVKSLLTNIKNNDKLVNALASITGEQSNTLKQKIEEEITAFNQGIEVKIEVTSNIIDGKVKNINLTFNDDIDKIELNVEVVGDSNYNFTLKSDNVTTRGSLNSTLKNGFKEYSFIINDNEMGKVNYTIGYKLSTDEALVLPDLSNVVDYTQLTTDDTDMILTNLFQNEGIIKLYEAYSQMNQTDNTYNEDFYTDEDIYNTEDPSILNQDGFDVVTMVE